MRGVRLEWSELPAAVRQAVEQVLGSPVVEARSQPAGFSPGSADRVVTATGARAFVKAVSPAQNPDTPRLHRREVEVLTVLEHDAFRAAGAPRLLGVVDEGEDGWIALVVEEIEGRHPVLPWTADEVTATLDALERVAGLAAPADWPGLESELGGEMSRWQHVLDDMPPDLDPWLAARLPELHDLARRTAPRLAGPCVSHTDVRADNLLVEPGGRVRVVDWPWACRGAGWADAAMLLLNMRWAGDLDVRPFLPRLRALGAEDGDVLGLVAGLTGFLVDAARRPPAPGLPTLRAFQAEQARAGAELLRELW